MNTGISMKKLISIVTPCYNEEANAELVYQKVKAEMDALSSHYNYEHLFIDNSSTDRTPEILKALAKSDPNVKVILNARNFGHIRSPFHGLLQAKGDAIMLIVSDLQDPPELIPEFIKKWEQGLKIVLGVKNQAEESSLFFLIRRIYYRVLRWMSEIPIIENYTGFGLYDRRVVDILRDLQDPYPFFRGLICEIGFEKGIIHYKQPERKRGITKNNLYTLYDIGILGLTSHSKKPLRLATMSGFVMGIISFLISVVYLVYKLLFWDNFSVGIAPLVLGLFFFGSVQLFFLGIIGEYIGNIYTKTMNRPIVIEKERINF
jgi:glycosyltransferase involved in cell wall biosynthesis